MHIKLKGEDFLPDSEASRLVGLLKPFMVSFMQQAGDSLMADIGSGNVFNVQMPDIQKWINWKLNKSASEVIQATKDDLGKILIQAEREGWGIQEIADNITHLYEETYKGRYRTIARTETAGANNKAILESAKQAGMTHKIWITALDERTRPWHADANGQRVPISENFIVNGEELEQPGDPNGSPENIINCRCVLDYDREEG